ncbi:ZIP family metal transporter [Brevibacillus thermoruber]|uniref:ZIP family metal transporter n=1 Tax=Brevibacillus TaxID=55080 RepID=UPI001EE4FF27|nr:ZIP family metal transporter [Brevibacillus agri]MCG5254730.1 ZIP family metal transporter [Brevibacillus agri]
MSQLEIKAKTNSRKRMILTALLPLGLLVGVLLLFFTVGIGIEQEAAAPIENLAINRVEVTNNGFVLNVKNVGPEELTIAMVTVDNSIWNAEYEPSSTLSRFESGKVYIPYPWVYGEPHTIKLMTANAVSFEVKVPVAQKTPTPTTDLFVQYAVIGLYVGVIPVGLGLMWYPFMRNFNRKGIHAMLALTIGLLLFLVVDTFEEGLEIAGEAAGIYQGVSIVFLGALMSFLALVAFDQYSERKQRGRNNGIRTSYLLATGIGLHNLGEGLAIGSAFALGEGALGTFLVIGFTLHNITEGIGIAAPLLSEKPKAGTFLSLAAIAGAPAILGTWIGGFAFSPVLSTLFLGIGAGAIIQVVYVITKHLFKESQENRLPTVSWLNLGSMFAGIVIMYVTAFLVKF